MAEINTKAPVAAQLNNTFGQANAVGGNGKGTQKTPIMTFNKDRVYLGLKLVSYYDEKTDTQREPVPKITASFNGQFVEMPVDGKFWKAYAEYVAKFAKVLEGVKIENETIIDDVEYGKQMMAQFKNKVKE